MEAALLNLSTNARDAMADGGVLSIETAPIDVTPNHAPPNTDLPPGEYVCLVVRDTGHGMDPETKQRLFEPFYTTKERGRGTGLGLPSVLGGVEQNHGRIFVASELGKGIRILDLPAAHRATRNKAASNSLPGPNNLRAVPKPYFWSRTK